MNNISIFKNEQFGEIRVINQNNEPWFIGKDVADLLGYKNSRDALNKHTDIDERDVAKCNTLGGEQLQMIINESGLYSLILSSKLPQAKQFKRWVTGEVLPEIRKTGGYIPSNENDSDEDIMAKALLIANRKIQLKNNVIAEKERKLIEQQPKVVFADAVSASNTSILVGDLAKILKQNGIDVGANRLFERLRQEGYLIKRKGTDYNMPTQKSMELGLFQVKETSIAHSDGHISISKTSKVTGKGQVYFVNKFRMVN